MKILTKGFTLIELLVVVAIIALLLAVIVPSLKSAKRFAAAAVCLANENQLIKSWLLYAEDNDSKFIDADVSETLTPIARQGYMNYGSGWVWNWVGRPTDEVGTNINDTVDQKIRGFQAGGLWSYLENPKVYNCPADKRWIKRAVMPFNVPDGPAPGLWTGGYRTYSIGNPLSAVNGTTGENLVKISKTSEFNNAGSKIVFLEETDGYGWNHRSWNIYLEHVMNPTTAPQWLDPFAILHNGSSTFAYADGHADRYKWVDQQTRDMAEAQEKYWYATDPDTGSTADYDWFVRAYMPRSMPKD